VIGNQQGLVVRDKRLFHAREGSGVWV